MSAINPVPAFGLSVRDRKTLLRAIAHGLLATQVETINHPDATLAELSAKFARQMEAHGVELRLRRSRS